MNKAKIYFCKHQRHCYTLTNNLNLFEYQPTVINFFICFVNLNNVQFASIHHVCVIDLARLLMIEYQYSIYYYYVSAINLLNKYTYNTIQLRNKRFQ